MMCKKLEDGMLLTLKCPSKRGWFHPRSHDRLKKKYKEIPPKFVIGPDAISILMRLDGIKESDILKPGEICVYLGRKKMVAKDGSKKTLRLVLVNGKVGFIEGRHIKHLEPV